MILPVMDQNDRGDDVNDNGGNRMAYTYVVIFIVKLHMKGQESLSQSLDAFNDVSIHNHPP
jgi:hypothetical protein